VYKSNPAACLLVSPIFVHIFAARRGLQSMMSHLFIKIALSRGEEERRIKKRFSTLDAYIKVAFVGESLGFDD